MALSDEDVKKLDRWFNRWLVKLSPILFVTIPLTLAFQMRLFYIGIEAMPLWMFAIGMFSFITVGIACAYLLDRFNDRDSG
jgi:hypothetical protein